jgi:threonine/homoserine/homoserine lactone efflux protein
LGAGAALAAFTAAAAVLTITPGLDTALVLRTAAVEGRRPAFMAALGICLGCLCWGGAAAVGLGALLDASELGYDLLRAAGTGYLLFLGARMLLHPRASPEGLGLRVLPSTSGADSPQAAWFVRGLLTNLLNPKVGVFYVSFLPLFVPAGVGVRGFSLLLASIHASEGILWFALLIAATDRLRGWLGRPGVVTALDRGTGAVLVGFGLRLAVDRGR